jgi:Protein of unknown function (DUF4238)
MGHHYNPQRLLRNFQDPHRHGFIWQHDKRGGESACAAIKQVAQQRNFYEPETETTLNTAVEIPGNNAIDKILDQQPLTIEEQIDVAIYVGTMLRRVPFHREWARAISKDLIPKAMETVRENARRHGLRFAAANQLGNEWVDHWMKQIDEAIGRLDGKASEETTKQMHNPFPSEIIVATLLDMTWRVIETSGPQLFITSDNPAVYIRYEGYGLGGKEAELAFPISPNVALHGSRNRLHPNFSHVKSRQKVVREINKRLVSQATRFAFTHDKASWLSKLLPRDDLGVMRIGW